MIADPSERVVVTRAVSVFQSIAFNRSCLTDVLIFTPLLTTSAFTEFISNHAIRSRIIQPGVCFFTVPYRVARIQNLQSCTELGARTGGKPRTTCDVEKTSVEERREI